MRADKTAAEMDKQLKKCDASELLRTKANLVLRLLMRARGDCVSRSIPRDQETTRSRGGGKNSLSIRPSYGVRGEEILDEGGGRGSIFRFHISPFPQKRLILRLG